MKIKELNCETGKEIIRDATADEIAQAEADALAAQAEADAQAEAATKKATAEAKLAALGLTSDDLKALGL